MDDRIRAAERSGDRQRLLVELHRAGKPIGYQKGDKVKLISWAKWDVNDSFNIREPIRKRVIGKVGVIVALPKEPRADQFLSDWIDVRLEDPIFTDGSTFICRDSYTLPCCLEDLEPAQ